MNFNIRSDTNHFSSNIAGQKSVATSMPVPTVQQRCLGLAYASILRLLSASWRVQVEGQEILDEFARSNRRFILAFWHRHYITLFRLLRERPIIVVTNQSPRGQIIANICNRTGMRTVQVRGKGSKGMLESLNQATVDGLGLGIAVDGPLGPACEVKRVVPHLAAKLECPIVPISVEAGFKYTFANRWDRLEIPYIGSRVKFVVGTPIDLSGIAARPSPRDVAARVKQAIECAAPRVRVDAFFD